MPMYIVDLPKHNNEICIYLAIFGDDFDPDELTKTIGIAPTHTYRKGDSVSPGSKAPKRSEDCWEYNLGNIRTIDSDEISDRIEETFKDKVIAMRQLITQRSLCVRLYVVLYIDPWQTPAVGFKPSFIKMLGDINAEIEMDIYIQGVPFKEIKEAGYGSLPEES